MTWLPLDFEHPLVVELPADRHLRPIRETDVDIDFPAVMGSRDRLWTIYGSAWGWPQADLSYEEDRADLARHEREIEAHESFNYAVLDRDESRLLGCVYLDPPESPGADVEVSWWVVDDLVGSEFERALADFVPEWICRSWPFATPRYGP